MADLNLGNLRPFLDEEEKFAKSIKADDTRAAVAKRMLGNSCGNCSAARRAARISVSAVLKKRITRLRTQHGNKKTLVQLSGQGVNAYCLRHTLAFVL